MVSSGVFFGFLELLFQSNVMAGSGMSLVRSWNAVLYMVLLFFWGGAKNDMAIIIHLTFRLGDCRLGSEEGCSSAQDLHVKSSGVTGPSSFSFIQEAGTGSARLVTHRQTACLWPHLICDLPTRNHTIS